MLKQGLNYVKSRIREAAAQARAESPPSPKTYSWTAAFVLRVSFAVGKAGVGAYKWKRWVLKQGLNHAKSRIRDAWKRWVLKQGLNYVEARITEAAAQAHAESPPRPKTYSWTAAFRAPCVFRRRQMRRRHFDLRTRRNQRCVTLGFLCVRKSHHATKNCCVLTLRAHGSVSMRTETCSCERTAAISRRTIR